MSGHNMAGMKMDLPPLDRMIETGRALNLAPPVNLSSPAMGMGAWRLQSDSGNRTLRASVMIDPTTLKILNRKDFKDNKIVDQVVSVGISVHEGQLFGPVNQALGVLAALGLITLSVSAFVMWWQRRPEDKLGAPMRLPDERLAPGLAILIIGLGIFLPVLGISLIIGDGNSLFAGLDGVTAAAFEVALLECVHNAFNSFILAFAGFGHVSISL
eukprot:gene33762-43334_t